MILFRKIDSLLHAVTMYKLVLFGLLWLAGISILLAFLDILSFDPWFMLAAFFTTFVVSFASNTLLAKLYKLPTNNESFAITGLILFFIIAPPKDIQGLLIIALAAALAQVSKYILTWRGSVIFNPAALSALIIGLTGLGFVSWWVATPPLAAFTALLGLLIVRKNRTFLMAVSFLVPAIALIVLMSSDPSTALSASVLSWPTLFLAGVMLTEPNTLPGSHKMRIIFGLIVGVLFSAQVSFWIISSTPQLALIIGNAFAFLVSFRQSLNLTFVNKKKLSESSYAFTFKSDQKLRFKPGQHIDLTLKGVKLDIRGNRRTFSITSANTSDELEIAIKINEPGSAFKKKLMELSPGAMLLGSRIEGDFVVPKKAHNVIFLAGGIGITPFVSMLRNTETIKRLESVQLLYVVSDKKEIVFEKVIHNKKLKNLKTNIFEGHVQLDENFIAKNMTILDDHYFFISGPPGFVKTAKTSLINIGISRSHIKTDFFSGY